MPSERPEPPSPPPPRPSSASSRRPGPARAKRPWYLVVALVLSLLFGAGSWVDGCKWINFYREPESATLPIDGDLPAADRAKLERANEQRVDAYFSAKNRFFALSVAEFVLGAAMLALTVRALGGQRSARSLLVQIVAAQAVLVLLAYVITPDLRDADAALVIANARLAPPPKGATPADVALVTSPLVVKAIQGVLIAMHVAGSLFIMVALTRRSTRKFYDAASESLSER